MVSSRRAAAGPHSCSWEVARPPGLSARAVCPGPASLLSAGCSSGSQSSQTSIFFFFFPFLKVQRFFLPLRNFVEKFHLLFFWLKSELLKLGSDLKNSSVLDVLSSPLQIYI